MSEPPPSLWWSTLDAPVAARASLHGHLDVDVAIVGGGYTGLWTARELVRRDPDLRIAVLEKSLCGFGASGRNGGWASALYPQDPEKLIERHGLDDFHHLRRVLQDAVRGLGEAAATDGIDAHYARGGSLTFARSDLQAARLRERIDTLRGLGVGAEDLDWLDADAARRRGALAGALGAAYTPHCARIQPARLVRGLADAVAALGVSVFEETAVTRITPRRRGSDAMASTPFGSVHASFVVRATEGFTPTLPGERRTVAPLYSLMIATEPLSDDFWRETGFADVETFADDRRLIVYGQRTRDNRIAFGGRGAPYHFGSTIEERFDANAKVFSMLEDTVRELFPAFDGVITHAWGGPLAMPRDHSPSVVVDYASGLASAGGYTGDGVVLSYVCANALADLITDPGTETDFTRLPFVQHRGRRWEPEPLRWLGINAGVALASWADHHEARTGVPSRAGTVVDRLLQ